MPKISIITTAYKHQDFIVETIESILSQTFTDWELLIWDDSPDDLTWNIIQAYVNKYPDKIKAWHNNPNKWIVDNMNFLLENVSVDSEYVAFLEWDDLYTPDNLKEKLKVFERYPEVWMVYNNLDFIDEKWEIFLKNFLKNTKKFLKNEKISLEYFINSWIIYWSYSSLMIKTSIIEKMKIINPTNNKLFLVSDSILFWRVASNYNSYWIEKSLTLYRRHNWNLTINWWNFNDDLIIELEYFKKIDNNIDINYTLLKLKMLSSYKKNKKLDTIKYVIYSFKYSLYKDLVKRIWVLILSCLPYKLSNFCLKR